ncbi:MAG: nickel-responsive transcriptional regulator NikR [bacterium]|nr:nickel-responsive transcriptional regulator NikR [Candidatus Sumerlaeota bacterium]
MGEAARYTVSMDGRLLEQFDELIDKRGYANRSEAIRGLIRGALVEEQWSARPAAKVAATITLVYSHHAGGIANQVAHTQHHHCNLVVSSTHVHLDNDNCLEVVIVRGPSARVRKLAEELISLKGIKHGKAVFTTEGKDIV